MKAVCVLIIAVNPCAAKALEEPQPLSVREFGAKGDGKSDDAPAIQRTIEAATKGGQDVFIPAGTYLLSSIEHVTLQADGPGRNRRAGHSMSGHIVIANANGLRIRGEAGTQLLAANLFEYGILVANSREVSIESVAIDYAIQPYTQGRIVHSDPAAGTVEVVIDDGWGSPLREDFHKENQARRFTVFDPKSRLLDLSAPQRFLVDVEEMETGRFSLRLRGSPLKGDEADSLFVLTARRPATAVYLFRTIDTILRDLIVYSAPGTAFGLFEADGTQMERCVVTRKPDTDRLISINSDAVHGKNLTVGPKISDCEFLYMDDDGINIASTYSRVLSQPDSRTVVVDASGGFSAETTFVFFDGATGEELLRRKAIRVEPMSGAAPPAMRLIFDQPVEGLVSEPLESPTKKVPVYRDAGERFVPTLVLAADMTAPGTRIENNRIGYHRGRGIVCNATSALLAGNRLERMEGPGIQIGRDLGWFEGPNPADVEIRDNVFSNVVRSNIYVADLDAKARPMKSREIGPLQIVGNKFENPGGVMQPTGGWGVRDNAIFLSNVIRASLSGNQVISPPPAFRPLIIENSGSVTEPGDAFTQMSP